MLLRQSLLYLTLSILIIFFAKYAHLLIVYIDMFYTYIIITLAPIFSQTTLSTLIRNVLALVVLPLLLSGIPALIYRAIKGKMMPYFTEITWFLWLIIVLSNVLIR